MSEAESIREMVETAVLRQEVAPLLRILFEPSIKDTSKEQDPVQSPGLPSNTETSPALLVISKCLQTLAAEQEQVILDICNTHAIEIASCVADMGAMQQNVRQLRDLHQQGNEALQSSGQALMANVTSLNELAAVQANVVGGLSAVTGARRLLNMCLQVGQLLEDRQLYQAWRLTEEIRDQHLGALLAQLAPGGAEQAGMVGTSGAAPVAAVMQQSTTGLLGAGGRQLVNLVALRAFFESLLNELNAAVEALAVGELHSWLVSARGVARSVGLRAMRRAAISRQQEEDLAKERLLLSAFVALADVPLSKLSATLVGLPYRNELLVEGAWPPVHSKPGATLTSSQLVGLRGVLRPGELKDLQPDAPHAAVAELLARWQRATNRCAAQHVARTATAATPPLPPSLKAPLMAVEEAAGEAAGSLTALGARLCAASDAQVPLLAAMDMHGLYRCVHIHEVLGRGLRLREYYGEQRRLQVAADCAPPSAPFVHCYKQYLEQLVGIFAVEACVGRLLPDLVGPATLDALWEGAATQLKAVLERHLVNAGASLSVLAAPPPGMGRRGERSLDLPPPVAKAAPGELASQAPIMVTIKDYVLLACDALEEAGCSAAVIEVVLLSASARYHNLLLAAAAADMARLVASDPLAAQIEVRTPVVAQQLCGTLGLPARLDLPAMTGMPGGEGPEGGLPTCPFAAPFTPLAPAIVRLVRAAVEDSAAYLRGLLPPWEVEGALQQQRDRLVAKVVVEALMARVAGLAADAGQLRQSMRLVSNAWCLARCAPALDAHLRLVASPLAEQDAEVARWRAKVERQSPVQEGKDGVAAGRDHVGSTRPAQRPEDALSAGASVALAPSLTSSLHLLQESAERAVLQQVAGRVESLVAQGFANTPWLPPTHLPPGPSPHVEPLVEFLHDCFTAAQTALPRSSWVFLMRTTLKTVAIMYMKLFSPDGVKGYNLLVVERLAQDVACLQAFAARFTAAPEQLGSGRGTGRQAPDVTSSLLLPGTQPVLGLAQQFTEADELFQLLLTDKIEEVLAPDLRRSRYPNLEPSIIVLALDRYRELLKIGKDKTTYPTRKVVDGLAKALRGQMVAGTAASVLRDF